MCNFQCFLVFVFLLVLDLLHLHHPASCATVTGCSGHLCSTVNSTMVLFAREQYAILFSRCHAACAENVSADSYKVSFYLYHFPHVAHCRNTTTSSKYYSIQIIVAIQFNYSWVNVPFNLLLIII